MVQLQDNNISEDLPQTMIALSQIYLQKYHEQNLVWQANALRGFGDLSSLELQDVSLRHTNQDIGPAAHLEPTTMQLVAKQAHLDIDKKCHRFQEVMINTLAPTQQLQLTAKQAVYDEQNNSVEIQGNIELSQTDLRIQAENATLLLQPSCLIVFHAQGTYMQTEK